MAADMPVKAPVYKAPPPPRVHNWTGCHIGVNVGWSHSKHDLSTYADPAPQNNINDTARTAIINAGLASLDDDAFTGGGQVGCDWQFTGTSVVVGAEGDFNYLGNDASRDTGNYVESGSGRTVRSIDDIKMHWLATVRGRVGWAFDRILVYATGGLAITRLDISKQFAWNFTDGCTVLNGLNDCHVGGSDTTRTGWTVGGGVEWAFDDHWSVKGEYLYADFGDVSYQTSNSGVFFTPTSSQIATHTVSTKLQIARIGVNYKF